MTGARRYLRVGWLPLALVVMACDLLLTEPATGPDSIEIQFQIADGPLGQTLAAFERVERVHVRLTAPDSLPRDTIISVLPDEGVVRTGVKLRKFEQVPGLQIYTRLGYGDTWLFGGTAMASVEPGAPTTAEIVLEAIASLVDADRDTVVIANVGSTAQLAAAVLFASGDTIAGTSPSWTSLAPGVVTVTPAGFATAVTVGQGQLTVAYDTLAPDTVLAIVSAVDSGVVTPANTAVLPAATLQYSVAWRGPFGNVLTGRATTWSTDDASVATIDAVTGQLTAVAPGITTVMATAEGVDATTTLTVLEPVTQVVVSPPTASIFVGSTVQLSADPQDATGTSLAGRAVTWSTGDAAVATVDASGLVTGVGPGTAVITATSEGVDGTASVTAIPPSTVRQWLNPGGGAWSDGANWSGGVAPAAGDSVEISLDGTYTVTLDADVSLSRLEVGGTAGSQTLQANGRVVDATEVILSGTGTIDLDGSTLTGSTMVNTSPSSFLVTNSTVSVALDNQGRLEVDGAVDFTGGLTTSGASVVELLGATATLLTVEGGLVNDGVILLSSSGSQSRLQVEGGTLTNGPGGVIQVNPGFGGTQGIIANLDNQGLLTVGADLDLDRALGTHQNSGTLDLSGGSLRIVGATSFINSGAVTIAVGLGLEVRGGAFDHQGSITGGGTLTVGNGTTASLTSDLATGSLGLNVTDAGTVLSGPGTLTVSAGTAALVSAGADLAAEVVNEGTLAVSDAAVSGALSTTAGSVLNSVGASSIAGGFTNLGRINISNAGAGDGTLTVGGSVINAAGATVAADPSNGGSRTLGADLEHRGALLLDIDLAILGSLIVPTADAATVTGGGTTLAVGGLDVDGVTFDNASLIVSGGGITRFDAATFQNMDPAATQLTIGDPGAATPYTFDGLVFSTPPTTGLYLSATDEVADANTLTIDLTNSSPADGSGATITSGGAIVNWVGSGSVQWIGGSGLWSVPSNWSSGAVPTGADDVEITLDGTYTVTVDVSPSVASLTLGSAVGSQTLQAVGQTLNVGGTTTLQGGAIVDFIGSSFTGPTVLQDATSAVILNGSAMTVPTSFQSFGSIEAFGTSIIDGPMTTAPTTLINLIGVTGTSADLTISNGFTSEGTIQLTESSPGDASALVVSSGTIVNDGTILIDDAFGTDVHIVDADIDNQGTITANVPVDFTGVGRSFTNGGTVTSNAAIGILTSTGTVTNLASGTLDVAAGSISVDLSGGGTLTTAGSLTAAADLGVLVTGGTVEYTGGTWSGAGGLLSDGGTVTLSTPFTNGAVLALDGATVQGSPLTVQSTGRLEAVGSGTSTVNVDVDNQGTVEVIGGTLVLNGALTTAVGSALQVQEANGGLATMVVASGFINNGDLQLTNQVVGGSAAFEVTSGTITNASPGGRLQIETGAGGGTRTFTGNLDHQGDFFLDEPLTFNGLLSSPAAAAATLSGTGATLTVAGGVDIDGLTVTDVPMTIQGGPLTTFNNVVFGVMDPAATQLTVVHPGAASAFVLDGLTFQTAPTTGLYISANDDVADANTLTLDLTNSTPTDGSAFTETVGGAVVNWVSGGGTPVGYWRFESGTLGEDSQGSADLTLAGSPLPAPVAPGATGPGSDFPTTVLGQPNATAADLGNGGRFTSENIVVSQAFTVEAFVHFNTRTGNFGKIIVGAGDSQVANWNLQVRLDGLFGSAAGELIFGGNQPTQWQALSGIILDPGVDYYVAAAYDPAGDVTFWVQDLSTQAPLQTVVVAHGNTNAIPADPRFSVGDNYDGSFDFEVDGVIDEVRLTDRVLTEAELLVPAGSGNLVSWNNPSGGLWSDPNNWDPVGVPDASSDVEIALDGTYTVTMDVDPTVASLVIGGGLGTPSLTASGRTISSAAAVEVLGNAELIVANQTIDAALVVDGVVEVSGTTDLTGGTTVSSTGTLRLQAGGGGFGTVNASFDGLTNDGLVEMTNISGSSFSVFATMTSGTLVNGPTGTLDVLPGTATGARQINGALDNQGTINLQTDLTLGGSSVARTNSGTIDATGGSLSFSGTGSTFVMSGGAITVGAAETLAFNSTDLEYVGGTIGGAGAASFASTVTLTSAWTLALPQISMASSTVIGSPLTVGSATTLSLTNSTASAALVVDGVVEVSGTTDLTGGTTVSSTGTLRLQAGGGGFGTVNASFDGLTNDGLVEMTNISGSSFSVFATMTSGTLVNGPTGTLDVLPGTATGARQINGALDNQGTINLQTDLDLFGQLSSPALSAASFSGNGSALDVDGLDVQNATFDNVPLTSTNGTITAFDNVTFQNMNPAGTQLTINHPGVAVPFTFDGVSFLTTPTTGFYLSANDNVADANVLTINLPNSTPADGSGSTSTSGGAVVIW